MFDRKSMVSTYKTRLSLWFFLLFLFSCGGSQKTETSNPPENPAGKKEIAETSISTVRHNGQNADTCSFKPTFAKINTPHDEGSQSEIYFYSGGNKKPVFHYSSLTTYSSCNDVGLGISNHEIKEDTLRIYTFWCHIGDPTGHEWGARIMTYVWDCETASLKKSDSRLHVEMEGDMGGFALEPGSNDPEMIQERERFKRSMERLHKGKFVIGIEAEALIKRTKKFLKKDIKEITDHFIPMFDNSFGYQI